MDPSPAEMPRLRLLAGSGSGRATRSAPVDPRSRTTSRATLGDRRIALALHAAQVASGRAAADSSSPAGSATRPRTLDEIVAMEQDRGWGQVFKALKSNGLLEEQTLGQVVARWARRGARAESPTVLARGGLRAAPSRVSGRIGQG